MINTNSKLIANRIFVSSAAQNKFVEKLNTANSQNINYLTKLKQMKKTSLILLILIFININMFAIEINADLFSFDEKKIETEFKEIDKLEKIVISNPNLSFKELVKLNPKFLKLSKNKVFIPINYNLNKTNNSSFWWTLGVSVVGSYTLYGAVAGPISVGIVYLSSKKDKFETKKAVWGCLTGTIIGFGLKYAVLTFM